MAETDLTEEWRPVPIPEFSVTHSVSNAGRVRRETASYGTWAGRMMSCRPGSSGYVLVHLRHAGRLRPIHMHRLVAEAFLGPAPHGTEVDHVNGIRHDNRAINLRYVSHQENMVAAVRLGLISHARGENNSGARLSSEDVRAIRGLLPAMSCTAIARRYGVCYVTVWNIAHGKTWKHVV